MLLCMSCTEWFRVPDTLRIILLARTTFKTTWNIPRPKSYAAVLCVKHRLQSLQSLQSAQFGVFWGESRLSTEFFSELSLKRWSVPVDYWS